MREGTGPNDKTLSHWAVRFKREAHRIGDGRSREEALVGKQTHQGARDGERVPKKQVPSSPGANGRGQVPTHGGGVNVKGFFLGR